MKPNTVHKLAPRLGCFTPMPPALRTPSAMPVAQATIRDGSVAPQKQRERSVTPLTERREVEYVLSLPWDETSSEDDRSLQTSPSGEWIDFNEMEKKV